MKNNVFFFFLLVLIFTGTQALAVAIDNEANPGAVLAAEGGAVNFNFSPGVSGTYVTEAATSNEQWFAVATYHRGGNSFFGSTSDSSSIYKQPHDSAEEFADVTIPDAPVAQVIVEADPLADPPVAEVLGTADEYWLANDWSK